MENRNILTMKHTIFSVGIILLAVLLRLLPHPANVAPIGAMALFGGAYLPKRYALLLPIAALFVSDIFLGFYSVMPFVYGSFVVIGLIGMWLASHKHIGTILLASLVSSVLFFLITNFGVWVVGNGYPKTLAGLASCFFYAIPFFRNTLGGDVLYTGIFFGGFEVLSYTARVSRIKAAGK